MQTRATAEDHIWSVVLSQPGSVLMSIAPESIKGHANARDLERILWPWGALRTMVSSGPALLPRAVSKSMAL